MIIVLINLLPQVTKPKTRSIRHRRLSYAASAQILANRIPLFGTPHTIIICVKNELAPWLVLFTLAHNDQAKKPRHANCFACRGFLEFYYHKDLSAFRSDRSPDYRIFIL